MRSIFILFLGLTVGCGGGADVPPLGTVKGKVSLEGAPVANAMVTFTPTTQGRPSVGVTDTTGMYSLVYTVGNEGAVIGEHTVTVARTAQENYEAGQADEESADSANADDIADSGLPAAASDGSIKKEVTSGVNEINIEL